MNHTTALIAQVEFLIQQLAGTEIGESQTVIEINDLIGKVRKELEVRQAWRDELTKHLPEGIPVIIENPLVLPQNPKNPE